MTRTPTPEEARLSAVAAGEQDGNPVTARLACLQAALIDSPGLDAIPHPAPVVDGMLYRDGLAWLHGRPATCKSFVALDWAGCVATGLPWQDHETTRGPVLYLIAEGTAGLRKRVRAWEDHAGCPMEAVFLPVPVQLLEAVDIAAFRALVTERGPALVVIDTQARCSVGADENSAREMGQLVQAADAIRAACHACVLLVHHEGRAGENMRGSSALDGAATSIFRTAREGNRVTVENIRQRDVPEAGDVQLRVVPRLDSLVLLPAGTSNWTNDELASSEQVVLDALLDVLLDTGASRTALSEVTKLPRSTLLWAVNRLVRRGLVVNTGTRRRPHYEAARGNVQLSPTASNPP